MQNKIKENELKINELKKERISLDTQIEKDMREGELTDQVFQNMVKSIAMAEEMQKLINENKKLKNRLKSEKLYKPQPFVISEVLMEESEFFNNKIPYTVTEDLVKECDNEALLEKINNEYKQKEREVKELKIKKEHLEAISKLEKSTEVFYKKGLELIIESYNKNMQSI